MPQVTSHPHGSFCWPELATTNPENAKRFYTALLGWTAEDTPAGEGMTYTMLRLEGKDVGALYLQEEEQRAQGVPPHWNTYVAVRSADESAERTRQLGGTVLAGPFDVMDAGRLAIIRDPFGAIVCLWEGRKHIGSLVVDEPGAMCWCECATRDAARAREFYSGLFGWTTRPHALHSDYTEFFCDGKAIGGMIQMTTEWGDIPSHWMIYFGVQDCEQAAAQAEALGGSVKIPPTPIPNVGSFAVLADPEGAVFSILQTTRS